MKKFFVWLVIGAGVCIGSSLAEESAASVVTQTQPIPAATPLKHLAPKGVFFVLRRLSVMTDAGVACAMPGTKVTLVRDGAPMQVTDGQHQYEALASQLTNDMDAGDQLAQAERSIKAKINQEILLKTQENQKAQQEQTAKAEEILRNKAANQQKAARLRQEIKDARQSIFDNKPGSMVPSPLFSNISKLSGSDRSDAEREQRKFIENKQKEVRDLQKELDEIEAGGTAK